MQPRNLKQALENGFIVQKIYDKGGSQIRVDLKRRYPAADQPNFVSFWINRAYYNRKYGV